MLCRVEMNNSEQRFGRFYRWKMLHLPGGIKGVLIVMLVLVALLTGATLLNGGSMVFPALIAGILLAYCVYLFYAKPNAQFRKKSGAAMETEIFIFTDNGFSRNVKNEESGSNDHSSSQYEVLVNAVETSQDFLLFTSPTQGYIIDKEYFTKGSPDEMRAVLKEKMGSKFKTKHK